MHDIKTPVWWRATLALGLGSVLVFVNLYVAQPLLPLLAQDFALSALGAGWALSASTLGLAAGLLFWARLADRVGRKRVMLGTLLAAILVGLVVAWAPDYTVLVALRGLQGFFLAGLPATAVAYMGEEFTPKALMTSIGIYIAANSLGGISGRVLGGLIAGWFGEWQAAFVVLSAISLLLWALLPKWLPDSRCFVPAGKGAGTRALLEHVRNPLLWPVYLVGGLNFMVFLNQYTYVAFYLSAPPVSLAPAAIGLLFLTYLTGTVASGVSGVLISRFGLANTLLAAIVLMAVGSLGLFSERLPVIITTLFIDSFAFFLAHACASSWVGRSVSHNRALASSLYLVFYYVGASLGGLYLYPFWQAAGLPGVAVGMIAVMGVTAALTVRLGRAQCRHADEPENVTPL
ncbi:MFS transporter [Oceanimonas baumannii]|uniref:MFS transporter n=1 Tax=Oceanimonas baumannii TaxID=129578 RepID=A0A235CA71_9GAMM|nr:MFS transporter [Oceanimonas baumannii]OYD21392.1 MFS transporter [Oceanimonas baumannii]TDW56390.1 YNFM family putative membrane transporter [Oceanimonas baumannii]